MGTTFESLCALLHGYHLYLRTYEIVAISEDMEVNKQALEPE